MADNTNLTPWDQYNMARVCNALIATAGAILRQVDDFKREKDQFIALGLTSLITAQADTDRVHGEGNAPTKIQLLDLSSLVDYHRKVILNDGTASTMTAPQARAILDRYAAG